MSVKKLSLRQILEILSVLRELDFGELLRLPDLYDSEDLRNWLTEVLNALCLLADYTGTDFDNKLLDQALIAITDAETWDMIYSLFTFVLSFFDKDDEDGELSDHLSCKSPFVKEVAEKVGCGPATIIMIVSLVISALRLLQEWRKRRNS